MKKVNIYDEWLMLLPWEKSDISTCPCCRAQSIDYLFIGDLTKRVGFCLVWCDDCRKGINISRTIIPNGVKAISFAEAEEKGDDEMPLFQFIDRK